MTNLSLFTNTFANDFEKFFNETWNEVFETKPLTKNYNYPKADVYGNNKEVVIEVAVPGLSKENVVVECNDGTLSVSGEKMHKVNGDHVRKELHRSSFKRSWTLNDTHNVEGITSQLENGLLTIKIPYREPEQKSVIKRIEVT